MPFEPEIGMKVIAQGDITVYEAGGYYQLKVNRLQPEGIGALQLAFDQLKAKLAAEGLFDPEHKRPVTGFAARVGIVTSKTGAALRDMVQIIRRRSPSTEMVLCPSLVQGEGAAESIRRGLKMLNDYGGLDVIIIGRGGGSMEDLWAFNDEKLARDVFNSPIPVISAVGHETDFTLTDFTADLRAPTPSAAAELAVADAAGLQEQFRTAFIRLQNACQARVEEYKGRLFTALGRYGLRRPADLIQQRMQRLDELTQHLKLVFQNRFNEDKSRFQTVSEKLNLLNPLAILNRGYSVVYPEGQNKAVTSAKALKSGDEISILFAKGKAQCQVKKTQP